ncbi:MAG: (d)CMP kinase, partial [Frankiales bacterium]|nr:(d)CMP kinase [Frankiales bacterium]
MTTDATALTRVVALDGPAGSGKSTVAKRVALALGWRYVDTGATFRAATVAVLRAGVPLDDADAVTAVVLGADVVLGTDAAAPRVLLDGDDVTSAVRSPEVTAAVSAVSAVPAVRAHL